MDSIEEFHPALKKEDVKAYSFRFVFRGTNPILQSSENAAQNIETQEIMNNEDNTMKITPDRSV